jgi:hypothetical protein
MSVAGMTTPISPPAINETLRALHAERLARHPPVEVPTNCRTLPNDGSQRKYQVGKFQLIVFEQPGLALGAHTWISSLVLSRSKVLPRHFTFRRYMQESLASNIRGKRVVELGAGTGSVRAVF